MLMELMELRVKVNFSHLKVMTQLMYERIGQILFFL